MLINPLLERDLARGKNDADVIPVESSITKGRCKLRSELRAEEKTRALRITARAPRRGAPSRLGANLTAEEYIYSREITGRDKLVNARGHMLRHTCAAQNNSPLLHSAPLTPLASECAADHQLRRLEVIPRAVRT